MIVSSSGKNFFLKPFAWRFGNGIGLSEFRSFSYSSCIRQIVGNESESSSSTRKASSVKIDSLDQILAESIKTTGPIPLSSYMKQCLTHPELGYYTTRDPLGRVGDFVTSPEISSMFGEMIGIWLYATWIAQGRPLDVQFVEFGPGKGTLLYDALKCFNKLDKNQNANRIKIVLVEASPVLRNEQFKKLCCEDGSRDKNLIEKDEGGLYESRTIWDNKIEWVETEKDIINDPIFTNYIIAHEFFDALPIHQFEKTGKGWREYLVDYSVPTLENSLILPSQSNYRISPQLGLEKINSKATFHMVLSPHETLSSSIPKSSPRFDSLPVGSRIEICPDSYLYSKKISELITCNEKHTGAALIIDYGPKDTVPINTLRGIKAHNICSPFVDPGSVDLSADVDFENLKIIFNENGCESFGPTPQGDWLHELGIGFRVDQLCHARRNNKEEKEKIIKSYKRLVGKGTNEMGSIYKFLGVIPKKCGFTPVGFGGNARNI
ncbi:hypothetical protein PACTADRAFT_50571 [Pachysolen tannophilus NRRL Y-2460]|uniref:Protein arginine methyltransferase NDUFAF7 n=1 Tax=Pachysolen tannophilus NRRL Y-2460 TaxID=669874 RepID=A0A1E4TSH7_PACTA|nr:hypothetical protein PACTADRAFT_50571 [Pachysolen tannophilus NRRL Y-2460]